MIIFPAIDIRGGKCVRLVEGRFDRETVFAEEPSDMAVKFSEAGAEFIHVVDLDGALAGEGRNLDVIKRIVRRSSIPIEVGGGVRTLKDMERLLDIGVTRVILGSAAVKNPELVIEAGKKFPGKFVVGIDARRGEVAVDGWGVGSGMNYIELGKRMADAGARHIIFTDISRDGKLEGLNITATVKLARETGVKVVASGGVAGLEDVRALLPYESDGVEGVIIGKAIYTGKVDLRQALALAAGQKA